MKTGEVIEQFVILYPFGMGFSKMALLAIYIVLPLQTGSHFFLKDPNYLLKIFLESIRMIKVPKIADKCQILAFFQSL